MLSGTQAFTRVADTVIETITVYTYFFLSRDSRRISDDPGTDALRIIFRDTTVTTQVLAESIAAEYDAQGRLVGIEILDAIKQLGAPSVLQQVIVERPDPAILSSPSRP